MVLADLTFANPNVYYELGIRHTLCKGGTVLVVQSGADLPFDVKKLKVLAYDRKDAVSLGDFQSQLRLSIQRAVPHEMESPVHVFLPGLFVCKYEPHDTPDTVIARLKAQVDELERLVDELKRTAAEARLLDQVKEMSQPQDLVATYHQVASKPATPLRVVEILGIKLRKHGFVKEAIHLFTTALSHHGQDAVILRELGFCNRKLGPAHYDAAAECFFAALSIRPFDSELHGMIGGMYKRQGRYQEALNQYGEADKIFPNDLYTVVNLGAVSAILNFKDEARSHYSNVLNICQSKTDAGTADYWTHICHGEALVYLGDESGALRAYQAVIDVNPPVEDVRSALEQLEYISKISLSPSQTNSAMDKLQAYINRYKRPD